jgi:hypothetical protein
VTLMMSVTLLCQPLGDGKQFKRFAWLSAALADLQGSSGSVTNVHSDTVGPQESQPIQFKPKLSA